MSQRIGLTHSERVALILVLVVILSQVWNFISFQTENHAGKCTICNREDSKADYDTRSLNEFPVFVRNNIGVHITYNKKVGPDIQFVQNCVSDLTIWPSY